jgi:hypothetical protein
MSNTSRLVNLIGLVLIALPMAFGLAGCGTAVGSPTPSICNGVSTEIGPCGGGPTFAGTTCESLAAEYGPALDRALLEIVRGPADVGGDAKSSRVIHAEAFVTSALTDRMVAIGIIEQCKMPAFLDSAKSGFSDELKAGIGHAMYDGRPDMSYQEFLDGLAKVMSGIGKKP